MSDSSSVDYKATILLPKTEFPMKGDLPQKEPGIIQSWQNKQIYQKRLEQNKNKQKFIIPDGPPYANGSIHIGHALNKILKDIIVKYKNMSGYYAEYIPGWDCHGLPIEHKVTKDLMAKKQVKSDDEILQLCRSEALHWVEHQKAQFQRLGVMGDWNNPYLTLDPAYEAEEIREFARAYSKGLIYRGVKPVQWNWVLQTALAENEVEYHPHKSPAIYVKFAIQDSETLKKLKVTDSSLTYVVIWTTTPWTLPANSGICFHPDFEYELFRHENENILIAKNLKAFLEKETGILLSSTEKIFKGSDLELCKARHPFIDRDSLFVLGLHVTADAGTGCVHTAPGHGTDDFKVGLKYNLPILNPVDDRGAFTAEVPEYTGINIFKANPMIVEKLRASGHLLHFQEIEHSYPHCWRSKVPLIYRTTPQWFLGMDLESNNIRQKALQSVQEIEFFPEWGRARLQAMIENRPDWCLSRQRIWGVPIPVFYCLATGEPLADEKIMFKVAEVVEKEGGIQAFHKHPVEKFIGDFKPKGEFGSKGFRHGKDILDVWFDSGVYHAAVQSRRLGLNQQADIYLEGSDQHRGWFNTSLLSSIATKDQSPYKALVTHGFVSDSQGRKMSKSLGNVVDPQEVIAKSGAEIIRLWCTYEDYGQDLTCGKAELDRVTETYRRIRNSMRFLLGVLNDFNPSTDQVAIDQMTSIDRWALHEYALLLQKVTEAYNNYEFYKVYHALNIFFTVTLSATYLDILKDRLYTWKPNGRHRRSSQTVIYIITEGLIRMMNPVLSFLAEESYKFLNKDKKESVYLEDFPVVQKEWFNESLAVTFTEVNKVRSDVQKELENLRSQKVIGSSLEAQVSVAVPPEIFIELKKLENDLREFFIVSKVFLQQGEYKIEAAKAPGEKCVRCWVYSEDISKDHKHPGVCPKCVEALT
ncbi:MAG: isoleucine--tRNA ligase [Pseudobdellovibrionaceae bacterium]